MLDFLKRKKPPAAVTPQTPLAIDCSVREDVNLGDLAKEKVTGFTGVVVAVSYEMDGTIFIALQPRELADNKPADALDFDIERIEVVEAGMVKTHDVEDAAKSILLGAIYRDRVTGFEGTAIRCVNHIGGCVRVTLDGKVDKEGKVPAPLYVPTERIELVDAGPAKVAEKAKTRTGGPGSTDRRLTQKYSAR